jgi:hypothetical protein
VLIARGLIGARLGFVFGRLADYDHPKTLNQNL